MKISLDALEILDAIDRYGSFSAAAESLHRVPSAISHAIARLEEDLDIRLFERDGRRTRLNDAGRTLLDDGRQLLSRARELEQRVQQVSRGWESELRIAIDAIIPIERIYPLIERFHATAHPTEIQLRTEVLGGTWEALLTKRADLALGAPGDPPGQSGVATRLLTHPGTLIFVVPPWHPLASHPDPIPADILHGYRTVTIADSSRESSARSIGLLEKNRLRLTVSDIRAKASAQIAGLGVGHLPRWLAAPAIAAGQLIEKQLAEPSTAPPLHIAWRQRSPGQALRWFLDALDDETTRSGLTAGL